MKTIQLENEQPIAVLRLANGVTNAINPTLVTDMSAALIQIQQHHRGMILTGGTKFFCIGLDLPALLPLSKNELIEFWTTLDRLVLTLYTLPIPTACVVSGHATAGGTILALACDFRYSAYGRRLMGLNEIKIGVPVPYLTGLMLRQIVGDRVATEMTYSGDFFDPEQALSIGLVDEIFPDRELETKAIEKVAAFAGREQQAFRFIKNDRVEEIKRLFEKNAKSRLNQFIDCWFEPDVQTLLHKAAATF